MNFIFISPNFPENCWQFCDRLHRNGVNVLTIGDAPYFALDDRLKSVTTEYYYVDSLKDYDQVYRAVAFFAFKYGRIDWIESNNEYWLEQDAMLRTDFHVTTGVGTAEIGVWKHKRAMKPLYQAAGIPVPRAVPSEDLASARVFVGETGGYPVIAKPEVGIGTACAVRIDGPAELERFFSNQPAGYVLEEFVEGDIVSYDAIADSRGEPLFESAAVWPPSILDMVNGDRDLAYYVCPTVPEQLRTYGRAALKAFDVTRRFVHLEFFRLDRDRPGLGNAGDFVALKVNMRPGVGCTPDMMNFAHSTDVYQIWADMVTSDALHLPDSGDHHWCVYAGRKDWHSYRHSHEEILARYGNRLGLCHRVTEAHQSTMGSQMYVAHAADEAEVREFIDFVQAPASE